MKTLLKCKARQKRAYYLRSLILALIMLSVPMSRYLFAQIEVTGDQFQDKSVHHSDNPQTENFSDVKNRSLHLDLECHSGTPPIIEFVLKDPEKIVKSIDFDFESDGKRDLSIHNIVNEVVLRGVPYREQGVYRATVFLNTEYGRFQRQFTVAFANYVWGKNNFSFANDGQYENLTDFVSTTLIKWAQERFGFLDQNQKVLLLSFMYGMYKGSIGRCYGFTGGQIYYLDHPERLLPPYDSVYTLWEKDTELIRGMDYVQNDIVFSNYLSGKINIIKEQDAESLTRDLDRIKESIGNAQTIIIGYISAKMHHSMVVYGYFENSFRNKTTLLTANNWERDQNNNVYSEDAENIVIQFGNEKPEMTWYDLTKKKYRYPEKIFAIVREDTYIFSPDEIFSLLEETEREILRENRIVVIVEKTETAYIVDEEGKRKGYSKPRRFNELEGVAFDKIDYNYIFRIPEDKVYHLRLKKRRYNGEKECYKKVNLFAIIPDNHSVKTEVFTDIQVDNRKEIAFRIGSEGISPE